MGGGDRRVPGRKGKGSWDELYTRRIKGKQLARWRRIKSKEGLKATKREISVRGYENWRERGPIEAGKRVGGPASKTPLQKVKPKGNAS